MGGVSAEEKTRILEETGYKEGKMPLRYLGVPLIAARLTIANCRPLIEKIMTRITSWTNKFLSYAGRTVLIKAVLYGIQAYWTHIFPIPVAVIQEIEKLCRNFLWNSNITGKRKAYVKWETICQDKKRGGLSMKNLKTWNEAAIFKNVWNIAEKKDSMWIRWIQAYYLKQKCMWEAESKQTDSWIWKHLVKAKNRFKEGVDLINGGWKRGKFSIRNTYKLTVKEEGEVSWRNLVWGTGANPRYKFFLWLLMINKLPTKDRISKWIQVSDKTCVLCCKGEESRNHLFLQCEYVKEIWEYCWGKIGIRSKVNQWDKIVNWGVHVTRGKKDRSKKRRAVFAAIVYGVWLERNSRVFHIGWNDVNTLRQKIWKGIEVML